MSGLPTTRLRYVAEINPSVRSNLPEDTSVSFLPMDAIAEYGELDLSRVRQVSEVKAGYSYFEDGDVAFAKVTPCFENGKGAVFRDLVAGVGFGTTELTVLRTKHESSARFLSYVLQSSNFRQMGIASMTGAGGLKRVSEDAVRDFVTFWPDLPHQERIANFLDDKTARIDALIAEKERLMAVLAESLEGCIERAVQPDGAASTMPLKRAVSRISTGPFGSALHSSEYVTEGIPVINPSHIVGGVLAPDESVSVDADTAERLSSYRLRQGQLVVGRRGEMGRCGLVPEQGNGWICGTGCLVVVPNQKLVDASYLQLVVSSRASRDWLSLESVGSTMENLNEEILGRLPGFFPEVQEQRRRVSCAQSAKSSHGALLLHVTEHIARLREYRSSLISAAVTGQLTIT